MTYSFHPEAEAELLEASSFYKSEGGRGVAQLFLSEVVRVADLLVSNPGFGTPVGGTRRSFPLKRFPYSVIYRATNDGIRILVIGHQHRRPGYWRGRK